MSKSNNLVKSKLFQIGGLILLALTILITATFGRASWRESTANRYLNIAVTQPTRSETPLYFQFASLLSSHPSEVHIYQAQYYVDKKQPDAAISVLAADNSDEAMFLKGKIQFDFGHTAKAEDTLQQIKTQSESKNYLLSKVYLENDKTTQAIETAKKLNGPDPSGTNALLLGCSYLMAGDSANANALMASVGPSEGVEALRKASVSKYGLAAQLAHSGLLNSAERVLDLQQVKASDEWQLWGTVRMTHKTSPIDLKLTAGSLSKAVKADPSNVKLRKLLREVYAKAGDEAGTATQTDLINRLESGTP